MERAASLSRVSQGRYRVIRALASGGTSTVHLVEEAATGAVWVAKSLHLSAVPEWKVWQLFERGAEVLRGLDHPGIPRFRELIRHDADGGADLWLIEEFVPGRDLRRIIERHGSAPLDKSLRLAASVLAILRYLHGRTPPVLHRDVKPSNIILRPDGRVALVDFGSVQEVLRQATLGGSTVAGTYGYMPPEQYMGKAEPASDLYAVGATLLHLVTGRGPSELPVRDMRVDYRQVLSGQPDLCALLDRLMDPRVERRVQTASEAHGLVMALLRRVERGERGSDGGPVQDEGIPAELEARMLHAGAGARCPGCGGVTDIVALGARETEVDLCPACHGVWLDARELGELVERPMILRPKLPEIARAVRAMARNIPDPVVYRRCARCETVMTRVNFGGVSGVIVDECRAHGMWLERGELDRIRRFVATGGMELTESRERDRIRDEARSRAQSAFAQQLSAARNRYDPFW
ncbi:MAG: zf-TFIIB domain-containing protein [Deltaproteobacteria bacterium]|nr:zf-TFIIB domain-containing protein [Deltaproteobacteria bacterium]MCB9785063.1 zf-TFIIB domain-containing protein [Deltaproteobacteria bacterium]